MPTYTNRLKLSNPAAGECNWDDDWYRNQHIKDALAGQNLQDNYVLSGGNLTGASGLNIDIDETVVSIAGVEYTIAAGTLSLTGAAAGEELMNWIYVNSSGVITVSTSAITITDYALIGVVDTNSTAVVRQSDLRRTKDYVAPDAVENDCINGTFNIWQRGSSQSSIGYGSADRFTFSSSGDTFLVNRRSFTIGQTDVPDNPEYYCEIAVTSVAGASNFAQMSHRILDVRKYSGKRVCVVFHAKANVAKDISVEGVQNFGSGGDSPVYPIGPEKISLTTSFQKFVLFFDFPSISGKTVGSLSYSSFNFWLDAGSDFNTRTDSVGQLSATVEISEIKFYISDIERPVRRRTKEEEYDLCLPYFCKTYGLDIVPGTVVNNGYIIEWGTRNSASAMAGQRFPTRMIQAPTVTPYSPVTLNAPNYVSNSGDKAASMGNINDGGFGFVSIPTGTTGTASYHYTADAEL